MKTKALRSTKQSEMEDDYEFILKGIYTRLIFWMIHFPAINQQIHLKFAW